METGELIQVPWSPVRSMLEEDPRPWRKDRIQVLIRQPKKFGTDAKQLKNWQALRREADLLAIEKCHKVRISEMA